MKEPSFIFPLRIRRFRRRKPTWIDRWHARHAALLLWRTGSQTYQCGGHEGRHGDYHVIDADKYCLMHWILSQAGYNCCIAEIKERCGVPILTREDGVLQVICEERA
jgi:hypothetical protein